MAAAVSVLPRLRARMKLSALVPARWRGRGKASAAEAVDLDEAPRGKARLALLAGLAVAVAAAAGVLWLVFSVHDAAENPEVAEPVFEGPHVVVPVEDRRPPPPKPTLADTNLPDARVALVPAPAEGLTEPGPAGPLPRVAEDTMNQRRCAPRGPPPEISIVTEPARRPSLSHAVRKRSRSASIRRRNSAISSATLVSNSMPKPQASR